MAGMDSKGNSKSRNFPSPLFPTHALSYPWRLSHAPNHDSMAGVAEATEAGREVGVCVIPGVEVSAYYDCHAPKITGGGAAANGSGGDGMEEEEGGVESCRDEGGGIERGGEVRRRDGEAEGVREGRGGQGVHVLGYFPPLGMRERKGRKGWQSVRRGGEGDGCGREERREGEEEGEDGEEGEEGGEGEGKKQRVSDDVNGAEDGEEREAKLACQEGTEGAAEGAAEGAGSVVGSAGGNTAGGESSAGGEIKAGNGLEKLVGVLEGIREGRHRRAAGMVQRLQQLGVAVTMADVIKQLDDPKTAPGRVHVARALVAVGKESSEGTSTCSVLSNFPRSLSTLPHQQLDDPKTAPGRVHVARALVAVRAVGDMEEAFQKYIGDHGPAYVR
ncbi:unnamed protein product [Closterium sp. Yama58-4]|nr:unnamed protein product [Closterium sp. Yama58-4]